MAELLRAAIPAELLPHEREGVNMYATKTVNGVPAISSAMDKVC
jgi:hypothetical protein